MIDLNKMWKTSKLNKKLKRYIKEVNYDYVNLKDYIIIDVRNQREFKEGHLDGAINISLSDIKRNIGKHVNNKQDKILVYCEYGIRSRQAVEVLENLGYEQVYNLKGGLENI